MGVWGYLRPRAVASVAAFFALGGTAFAAVPANSVGTRQLKSGAVTGRKVARHTLTGANINLLKLGTVPDAAHLGGLLPSAFQRLVSGSCLGNRAISQIKLDGSVACQATGTGTLTGVSGASGSGITGGGTSGSVTLGIDPSVIQQRITSGCASGQAITSVGRDGTPSCQAFGSGNGTITGVTAGTGLSGGGGSGNVSLGLASGYRLPQSCTSGQVAKADGSGGWGCAADQSSGGTVTSVGSGTGLTGGPITGAGMLSLDANYRLPQSCSASQLVQWSGSSWVCTANLGSTSWQRGGNAGTNPASDYLGTSDNQPLNLDVNGQQALQLQPNSTSPNLIGGYSGNSVTSGIFGATIAGGGESGYANSVTANFGTVAGGAGNTASGPDSTASGGQNTAGGDDSTAIGQSNSALASKSTALGIGNTAGGYAATALGNGDTASGRNSTSLGAGNTASGIASTASGASNTASNVASTALGYTNTASGPYSTAFGNGNVASGSESTAFGYGNNNVGGTASSSGNYSTAIGYQNLTPGLTAFAVGGDNYDDGTNSFAGGNSAQVPSGDDNTFVWSDGSTGATSPTLFGASGANQFDVRATGGVKFQTNSGGTFSTGCQLTSGGGAWSCTSDRNAKHGFEPVSDGRILSALSRLPITTWSYRSDSAHVRHIGPMAQDFLAAFHVGNDPRSIGLLDEGGVALSGIKGLYQLVQGQKARINRQQAEINHQQAQINWLIAQLRKH